VSEEQQAQRAMAQISALYEAAMQFETYRISHAAKGTPDGDAKAATNERMRDRMFAAMGGQSRHKSTLPCVHANPASLVAMAKGGMLAVMLDSHSYSGQFQQSVPLILEDGT
jgi:hypothetical protein